MYLKETLIFFILFECLLHFKTVNTTSVPRTQVKLLSLQENDVNSEWINFKNKHNKLFRDSVNEKKRFNIFKDNLKKINVQNEKYNNGTSHFTFGINKFSDMTSEEFLAYVNKGIDLKDTLKSLANNSIQYKSDRIKVSLPTSVDWRTQGYVNDIKDQSNCGCCWTFSSVSALESQYFKTNGVLLKFSEQQLVDCVYLSQGYTGKDADGCQGGFMTDAFSYIKQKGIALSSSYPFTSGTSGVWGGSCKYSTLSAAAQISGYVAVTNGIANEALLTDAIANQGPISVAVYASSAFQHYSSGVFTDTTCPSGKINHAVTLVGYGTLNGQDYYILRNSWGTSWGQNGYMLFRRNNNNQCGIASYASYPLVKGSSSSSTTTSQPSTTKSTVASSSKTSISTSPNSSTQFFTTSQAAQTNSCYKGSGWYADPGCQTGYYCIIQMTNYTCSSGYLFDVKTNYCQLASLVACNPLSGVCPNGTGYYTYTGCQKLYYCRKSVTKYYCNPGYLLDPSTGNCRSASKFTCPV